MSYNATHLVVDNTNSQWCNSYKTGWRLTFEGACHIGLPDIIVTDSKWFARFWYICCQAFSVDAQEVSHYGDRGTRVEVGLSKYPREMLILLRVEVLSRY